MQVSSLCIFLWYTIALALVLYIIFNIYLHIIVIIVKSISFHRYILYTLPNLFVYNVNHILIHINHMLYSYILICKLANMTTCLQILFANDTFYILTLVKGHSRNRALLYAFLEFGIPSCKWGKVPCLQFKFYKFVIWFEAILAIGYHMFVCFSLLDFWFTIKTKVIV